MVGLPYDFLANPQGAVRSTFDEALRKVSGDPAAFDGKDWGAIDLFRKFLDDDGGHSQVQVLRPSTMARLNNTLVRFRGMIQDMLGNELYVGTYKDGETWKTNKFGDFFQFPMVPGSPDMRVWERRLLYCVPVPGQNSWIEYSSESLLNPSSISSSPQREKRHREDDTTMNDIDMQVTNEEVHASTSNKKMREDGITSNSSNPGDTPTVDIGSATSVLPYFDRTSLPCLVKIYDSPESDLKLNDVFDFIGVLTFDLEFSVDKNDDNDFLSILGEDDTQTQMPPSKVPRLHCLIHKKLSTQDFISVSPTLELKSHLVKEIRETLLRHLMTILGNDGVAANFMLLHLLSKVHARVDSTAVGKLSLNLTCFNKETLSVYGHRLNLSLKNLLPFTHCVPLTVDYLNKIPLAPKKDYQTNRLASGILQLAEGSHLTFDETQLQEGTLNSTGLENARVLKSLLEWQKVEYDFTYYKMNMPADIQLLVLSEGKSNILPADVVLPFRPLSVDAAQDVEIEVLQSWRWYLATMRSLSHSISQEMQKVVEDDLVAARQADRSLDSLDFSRFLTMGRLVSLSFGETTLKSEHWQMAKELELLRKERL